jgi:hypothetical protein
VAPPVVVPVRVGRAGRRPAPPPASVPADRRGDIRGNRRFGASPRGPYSDRGFLGSDRLRSAVRWSRRLDCQWRDRRTSTTPGRRSWTSRRKHRSTSSKRLSRTRKTSATRTLARTARRSRSAARSGRPSDGEAAGGSSFIATLPGARRPVSDPSLALPHPPRRARAGWPRPRSRRERNTGYHAVAERLTTAPIARTAAPRSYDRGPQVDAYATQLRR